MEERPIEALRAAPIPQNQEITREIAKNAKVARNEKSCQATCEKP